MNNLILGLLSAALATNQPAALSNLVEQSTGFSVPIPDFQDPAYPEYRQVLLEDESALEEIDQWIREYHSQDKKASPVEEALLQTRIEERLKKVRDAYDAFLEKYPRHAEGYLAYGSFLSEAGEEHASVAMYAKAKDLNPNLPAAWNNLANYYGHTGGVKKSFDYYARAIELDPQESVYVYNLATTVFLFRKDAQEFYGISEDEVFAKAMDLYHKALELDPDNFILASEVARTYYGVHLTKTGDPQKDRQAELELAQKLLDAWEYAMTLARDDKERQGVLIHYSRAQTRLGNYDLARQHLQGVTNAMYTDLKERVGRVIDREDPSTAPPTSQADP